MSTPSKCSYIVHKTIICRYKSPCSIVILVITRLLPCFLNTEVLKRNPLQQLSFKWSRKGPRSHGHIYNNKYMYDSQHTTYTPPFNMRSNAQEGNTTSTPHGHKLHRMCLADHGRGQWHKSSLHHIQNQFGAHDISHAHCLNKPIHAHDIRPLVIRSNA